MALRRLPRRLLSGSSDDVLRVANCSGFYGDRASAAAEAVDGGPIDVLTGDYLSELTLAILLKDKRADPANGGYAKTFLRQLEEVAARTKQQYKQLEERRRLEAEGFRSELTLMHKEVQRVELRVFGQRTPLAELGEEETLAAVGARGPLTDAKLNATKQHLAAVRARIATLERGTA